MSLERRYRAGLMRRSAGAVTRRRFGVVWIILIFVSLALLVLSRLDHGYVRQVRWQLTEILTPLLGYVSGPLEQLRGAGRTLTNVFELAREVERLKAENQRLKGWEWRAMESERKLADLASLTSAIKEQPTGFVTSRVIANSSGPFVRSALINAGRESNVKTGYPVLSGDGLVGRIVETGNSSAQVLLLTDLNSRIPVLVGKKGTRGLVVGDNGPLLSLTYLPPETDIEPGDEVSTSGTGGLFPRGLRIGVVVRDWKGFRVRPHATLDTLEYLSVLFYETPTLGLTERGPPVQGADLRRDGASGAANDAR